MTDGRSNHMNISPTARIYEYFLEAFFNFAAVLYIYL